MGSRATVGDSPVNEKDFNMAVSGVGADTRNPL